MLSCNILFGNKVCKPPFDSKTYKAHKNDNVEYNEC